MLNLPFEEVKQRALRLISDAGRFCSRACRELPTNSTISRLGPILQKFFSRFESVKELSEDFYVSRQEVSNSTLRPGFVKIGLDFAHSELVVRPGEDRVFIVTDAGHKLDGLPSI